MSNSVRIKVLFAIAFLGIISCGRKEVKHQTSSRLAQNVKPEDNRFNPVVLTPEGSLDEPMMFQVSEDGSAYIIERKGGLKKFDPRTNSVTVIATIPVYSENEQGLIGLALDPAFEKNHWIYLQFAPPDESVFQLVRYELVNDQLVENSAVVVLKFPVERQQTNHTGGGTAWDREGNLYLTVGNNTGNGLLAQTDERAGKQNFDDQRAASNTNDLRGKILRIHPEADGTYTIPKGNLFPPGTPKTRPEIYTMGHRNVWRVSVDSKTGWIYWGEIGPDQDQDTETGPRGYDEQNQAKGPGFFGWPYFIADNLAIPKYDYHKNQVGEKINPDKPVNNSPNNTGLTALPPAQPALIYYPYSASEKFPLVGSSSRCAIGGPMYHRADFKNPERPYPSYYENKWLIADYSRFWIMAVTLDENGNYKSMERFVPNYHPVQPLDTKFGPEGDLYVLEYGSNPSRSARESKLVRIEYNAGNRKPVVVASALKRGGSVPFNTTLSGSGSKDYDGDKLTYQWEVVSPKGQARAFKERDAKVTFDKPGVYTATLTVKDENDGISKASLKVIAGNEPPRVLLGHAGNKTFFFNNSQIDYKVDVIDHEDGTLASGKIDSQKVSISIDYVSAGFDYAAVTTLQSDADSSSQFAVAQALINNSDCKTCHTRDVKTVGPAFKQIADRYKRDPEAAEKLIQRIIRGSSGIWGTDNNMPAHPSITENNARIIVHYIMNTNKTIHKTLPLSGNFISRVPDHDDGKGTYIIRAAYTDKGIQGVPSHTTDSVILLRSPKLTPINADVLERGALRDQLDEYVFLTVKPNAYILFRSVDLTGVVQISFRPNWHLYDIYPGGKVEIRLGSPDGELIGETVIAPEQFNTRYRGAFGGLTQMTKGQEVRTKRYPRINEKKFFAPGADKNSFTIPSIADLKPTKGMHDVYFVFTNDSVKPEESLMPLAEILMINMKNVIN